MGNPIPRKRSAADGMERSAARRRWPFWRAAAIAVILMGIAGCSLFSVNLKGPQGSPCDLYPKKKGSSDSQTAIGAGASNCTVDAALAYAAGWRKQFLSAAGQHSAARNANAVIGIPASAVAVFYGVSGHGSADRISRLSLGAAGYYSASSFLAPVGKQRAYLEGALALSCAIDAGLEFRFSDARLKALDSSLTQAISAQIALRSVVIADGSRLPDNAPVLARAAVVDADATNLIVQASDLRRLHENAGLRLAGVVERVVVQTAQLVTSQETGLQSLLAMVGGLKQTAQSFGLSVMPAKAEEPEGPVKVESSGGTASGRIEKATSVLQSALTDLLAHVRALEMPVSTGDAYDLCAPATAFTGFKVEPSASAQTVKIGATLRFAITNSQSNAYPTAAVSGKNSDAVKVSAPKVIDGRLVIEVTGEKATGSDPVGFAITDPTGGLTLRYTIAVLPADKPAAAANTPPADASKPAVPDKFAADFSEDDIKRMQCHLGLVDKDNDGVIGKTTYAKLVSFAEVHKLQVGSKLTQALFDAVLEKGKNLCPATTP